MTIGMQAIRVYLERYLAGLEKHRESGGIVVARLCDCSDLKEAGMQWPVTAPSPLSLVAYERRADLVYQHNGARHCITTIYYQFEGECIIDMSLGDVWVPVIAGMALLNELGVCSPAE